MKQCCSHTRKCAGDGSNLAPAVLGAFHEYIEPSSTDCCVKQDLQDLEWQEVMGRYHQPQRNRICDRRRESSHDGAKAVATRVQARWAGPELDAVVNAVDHQVKLAVVSISMHASGTIDGHEPPAMRRYAIDPVDCVVLVLAAVGEIAIGVAAAGKLQPTMAAERRLVEVSSTHGSGRLRAGSVVEESG